MELLIKENFWNEMEQKYPKAMAHFNEWIDKYKTEHDWEQLFGEDPPTGISEGNWIKAPKYPELPIAMQFGIFIEWYYETLKSLFPSSNMAYTGEPNRSIEFALQLSEPYFEKGILP